MIVANNKDEIKQSLTIEQVADLVNELGGRPIISNNGAYFIADTICHNPPGTGSRKLYYYDNTKLFRCFTGCDDTFDLYQLIMKVRHCSLPTAINFVIDFFNLFNTANDFSNILSNIPDWEILDKYEENHIVQEPQIIEMKIYDKQILEHLPRPKIPSWEQEGITEEVIKDRNICYDAVNNAIIIPHYDINNNLIGIRERTLIKDQEHGAKYKPAFLNGTLYNHALSFSLYNLNNSKDNIKQMQKAIIFESEKATMQYASYFGEDNDISVAVCGNSLTSYQVQLLLSLGVQEIIIAFDKQFKQLNDEEHKKWCNKLYQLNDKYSSLVLVSFIFDKTGLLDYKDSPTDKGKDTFIELLNERVYL